MYADMSRSPAPAGALPRRRSARLARAARRHPILACAAALVLTGAGMVLAVGLTAAAAVSVLYALVGII